MVHYYMKSFAASASMKAIALILAFVLQLVLARMMGAEWYGEVVYALAWVGLLAVIAVAGGDGAAVRFIAELDSDEKRSAIPGFLQWAALRSLRYLWFVLPAGGLLGLLLHYSNSDFALLAFLIVLTGLYFQARNLFHVSVIQGYRRPALSQFPLGVALPLLLLVAMAGFYLFDIEARSEYVAMVYLASVFIVHVWMSGFVKRQQDKSAAPVVIKDASDWDKVAHQLLLMAVIGILLSKFDVLLLGWFIPAEGVGIYNVSARLAEMVSLALVVSNMIVAPQIARYYQAGEVDGLQALITLSGRIVALVTLIAVLLLFIFGESVLGWYGEPFRHGYEILMILSLGQLINALFGPVGNVLIMTGHSTTALRIYAISAVIMMLLSLVLTPLFGMHGAAVATVIGVVLWNVTMCRYIVSRLGIDPTALGIFRRRSE